jgi:hypothetical protein
LDVDAVEAVIAVIVLVFLVVAVDVLDPHWPHLAGQYELTFMPMMVTVLFEHRVTLIEPHAALMSTQGKIVVEFDAANDEQTPHVCGQATLIGMPPTEIGL